MERIRELRRKRGMKQRDLAELVHTNQQTIARYESGDRNPDLETIGKLCEIFGCTVDYLLGRSEIQTPQISDEEWRLLAAWRQADDRARTMVELALEPWTEKKEKTAAS